MLGPSKELTINATQFKARCLDLMDQLAARKLTRITITKRGKPVSVMEPPDSPQEPQRSIIGCLADVMPRLSASDWDAIQREVEGLRGEWPDADAMDRSMTEQLAQKH